MGNHKYKEVGLFFYVSGKFLFHGCELDEAESYGDFLVYPDSHFEIWNMHYYKGAKVDFDYFPRGRVAFRKSDETFLIYCDKCIEDKMIELLEEYAGEKTEIVHDEHYQCHNCNEDYVL
ncbi:MAG: hypothetical protein IJM98_08760 [Oscillospiraceae bacterium]|nr:hypothetical protein [Oscillospiraceae bacterium]